MSRIFISYRRSDAAAAAGRIYDYLEERFGKDSVFIDVDTLRAGEDCRVRIQEAVGQCQVLLAVIGRGWLQAKDEAGRRRLENPADWVRLEIEAALERQVMLIPVLSEGVPMPRESELPESMQPLAYRQAAYVRHGRDFKVDMTRLAEVLQQALESAERQAAERRRLEEGQKRRARERAEATRKAAAEAEAKQAELLRQQQMKRQAEAARSAAVERRMKERKTAVQTPVRSAPTTSGKPAGTGLFESVQQFMNRRHLLQALGYSAGGLSLAAIGRLISLPAQRNSTDIPILVPDLTIEETEFEVATITDVASGAFETVRKTGEFFTETLGDGVTMDLMKIPSGTFLMGSPPNEPERYNREGPQHEVSVPSFFMGKYAVTQAQWRAVAGLPRVNRDLEVYPSRFEGDALPVERVSWEDAMEFCDRLSDKTNRTYRLPSEAEWEYVCRAGTVSPFHFGNTITSELANYDASRTYNGGPKGEYRERITNVGSFSANAFGLYDMHGNVWEWCQDHWHSNYEGAFTDASAWLSDDATTSRVQRGGSWYGNPWFCRSAFRTFDTPDLRNSNVGFRVSCSAPRI